MTALARYVNRTAVLPIAAAYAISVVAVLFVSYIVNGFVLLPALQGSHGDLRLSAFGIGSVHGRLISWIGPAQEALTLVILASATWLAARRRGRGAAEAECPSCLSPIPVAARVCRHCRREVKH